MANDVTIKLDDDFWIEIYHIDNELTIRLNGNVVYTKGQHGDPRLSEIVRLRGRFALGINNLTIELHMWTSARRRPVILMADRVGATKLLL